MATTTPFPFAKYRPAADAAPMATATFQEKVDALIGAYEEALGDSDKADYEDALSYEGVVEGLEIALMTMLDIPAEDFDAHHNVT